MEQTQELTELERARAELNALNRRNVAVESPDTEPDNRMTDAEYRRLWDEFLHPQS
jgi:hypothetical protein